MTPKGIFGVLILTGLNLTAGLVYAQSSSSTSGHAVSGSKPSVTAGTAWQNLTSIQKKALAPLAPHWSQLSQAQKNKWLAMSNNFDKLSGMEQATLHERMAGWAALSPQQRAQARLNFNETKALGADEKKTQWEAYQALTSEEKQNLAAQQKTGIQGAATASQTASPDKVIRLPGKAPNSSDNSKSSGIVIDKKTLLPSVVAIPEGS